MNLKINVLEEPELEFGHGKTDKEPKKALPEAGPFASTLQAETKIIRLGLVALPSEVGSVRRWVQRMHKLLIDDVTNAMRFREFQGAEKIFRCRFEIPDVFVRELDPDKHALALSRPARVQFDELLKLYGNAVKSLFGDNSPDCILVCFPEEVAALRVANPKLTSEERSVLEHLRSQEQSAQLEMFEPTEKQKKIAEELIAQAEELLYRNFHRALKADCMLEFGAVPTQVIRRYTYDQIEAEKKGAQGEATRAWNLALALYYKAGNIPWRPAGLDEDTVFVGVSFHHLKRSGGSLIYASLAQAFSSEVEPFALRGASIPHSQTRNKQPYLTKRQAQHLIERVLARYDQQVGTMPSRVVVHKTSFYQPEEKTGFEESLLSEVAACDLVWIKSTGFRLLRSGMIEPHRGTLCTVENNHNYLFTTGYVPWWDTYPGPHIPAPLQVGAAEMTNVESRAREIMALTKMNWNSADGIGKNPITISFARKVGTIMTEIDEDVAPNPYYRFYM